MRADFETHRRWTRWAIGAAVLVTGALLTYFAVTMPFDGHERVEVDLAWEAGLTVQSTDPWPEVWSATATDDAVVVSNSTTMYAVDPAEGQLRWSQRIAGGIRGEPLEITDDGVVLVSTGSGRVGIDTTNGREIWRDETAPELQVAASAASEGIAVLQGYMPTGDGGHSPYVILTVDTRSGETLWSYQPDEPNIEATGVAIDDQRVYIGLAEVETTLEDEMFVTASTVRAHDLLGGDEVWTVRWDETDAPRVRPVAADNRLVTVTQRRDRQGLVSLDRATGERRWEQPHDRPIIDAVAAGNTTIVHAAERAHTGQTTDATLESVNDETGQRLWRWEAPSGLILGLHADHDLAFVVTDNDEAGWASHALDTQTGEVLWESDLGSVGRQYGQHPAAALTGAGVVSVDATGTLRALDRQAGPELWSLRLSVDDLSTAPQVLDDTIHLVDGAGVLHVLNREDGVPRWTQRLGSSAHSPATHHEGHLYAVAGLGDVRAYASDTGDEVWRSDRFLEDISSVQPRPAVIEGVLVVAGGRVTTGLEPEDGTHKWTVEHQSQVRGLAATDTHAMVTELAGVVSAFDAKGQRHWSTDLGAPIQSAPTVSDDIIVVSAGSAVAALDLANGQKLWATQLETATSVDPHIHDGTVYVTDGQALLAVQAHDGAIRWRAETGETLLGRPHTNADRVYIATASQRIIEVDTQTGEVLRHIEPGASLASSPMAADDRVLIVTQERRQRLLALR